MSPDIKISQLYHTAWTAKEGGPTDIQSLVQTSDGYLWISSASGLIRFDGVRFEPIERIHGQPLMSSFIYSLWAPPSGGLRVGYTFGGASFIASGKVTNYGESEGLPAGSVVNFAQDKSGTLWVGTTRGLRRFDGSRWVDVSAELGLPETYVTMPAGAAVLWLLFVLRLRKIREKIRGQLEVRLDERERIARDLHDTLFQNIQGVLLTIDNSTNKLAEENSVRGELKDALVISDKVMAESRERFLELREEEMERKSIGEVLSQVGTDFGKFNSSSFRVVELGSSSDLHPVVFEEVLRICREAPFNAFQHSGAANIEVEILFAQDTLSVRIRDDGVGIDEQVLSEGVRPGHFGLKGMAERAKRPGAKLTIRRRLHAGTEIELSMPMNVAAGSRRESWERFRPWVAERL